MIVVGAKSGIIPANTGRIYRLDCRRYSRRDHPREYGENSWPATPTLPVKGSSPRIRGELDATEGKANKWRDHPREYGENMPQAGEAIARAGSSPRIRGECLAEPGQAA